MYAVSSRNVLDFTWDHSDSSTRGRLESRWAIEMGGNVTPTSRRWLVGLCWLQFAAATAAALATFVEVEWILGFCPAIALLGLVLALLSLRHNSLNLLLFGLLSPVTTGMIALLIASFRWSPSQAAIPALVLLVLNAGATFIWGALTARQVARSSSFGNTTDKRTFRFSLLGLFGVVTLTCIIAALLRQLTGAGEMGWFAVYGFSVLVLSLAVSISFWYRANRTTSEDDDGQITVVPG